MILTYLGLVGLLLVRIITSLAIAGSEKTSILHRIAVGVMQRVQTLNTIFGFAIFTLTITGFGLPYALPLFAVYWLCKVFFLPLRSSLYLLDLFLRTCASTDERLQTAVLRLVHFLILKAGSLRERCEVWADAMLALPSRLLWPLINNTIADRFVLAVRRLRARFWPSAPITSAVEVVLIVVIYFAKSDHFAWIFLSWVEVFLEVPKLVVTRIIEGYATATSIYGELGRKNWRNSHRFNSQIYEALTLPEEQSFRLITIQPGHRLEPLSCTLQVARLLDDDEHAPEYEAISYVWGSDPPSVRITVNGQSFLVSRSLHRNMVRLRGSEKPRTVWIDAICINQSDLEERARQVRCMTQIYSFARQVVVLLLGKRSPWGMGKFFRSAARRKPETSNVHYGDVRVATSLLRSPWWTRTWVIQEVVLARHVVVHCGAHELAWDDFSRLVHQASSHPCFRAESRGVHLEDFLAVDMHYHQRNKLAQVARERSGQKLSNRPSPSASRGINLLALMFDFRTREATDPRDKIFALQGLSEEPELCVPNYTRPAPELMVEFARAHVRHSRTLSILALAECIRQRPAYSPRYSMVEEDINTTLPSWCPAFTDRDAVRQGLRLRPLWTGLPDEDDSFGGTHYSAAGNLPTPENFEPSVAGNALSVQVLQHVCLTVSSVGPAYNASVDSLKRELMDVMNGTPVSMRSSLMGFLDKESVLDNWSQLAGEPSRSSAPKEGKRDGTTWARNIFKNLPADEITDHVHEGMRETIYTRRKFFKTQCGSFGLGPEDLLEGDEVYVALGCQTPVILRKEYNEDKEAKGPGRFLYIGQAYVEHLMIYQGNLADDLATGKVETERRVLV
ncbi:hypothetical protein PG984_002869 [Apiospora sp. TS-2023a]